MDGCWCNARAWFFEGTLAIAWTTGPMTVSLISQLGSVQHNHKPRGHRTLHRCSQSQHLESCAVKTREANGDTNKVVDNRSRMKLLPSFNLAFIESVLIHRCRTHWLQGNSGQTLTQINNRKCIKTIPMQSGSGLSQCPTGWHVSTDEPNT